MPHKHPEKRREYQRNWHAANRDRSRKSSRKWRAANPEKVLAISRKWHAANPDSGVGFAPCRPDEGKVPTLPAEPERAQKIDASS
jgi:hypothetical protein